MNILVLFILSAIALVLLIIHSYFYRGIRITLNFFIFAFIWAFNKEGHTPPPDWPYLKLYEFLTHNIPMIFAYWTATIGWIFTFYMSWYIAERILMRLDYFKNKIFATLLMSCLVIISISYCMEVTAMNIGWWNWKIPAFTCKDLFVGGYSLLAMGAWLFFSIVFLMAFFLIECSKYRHNDWKCIFLFIPFIYHWAVHFYGPRLPTNPIGALNIIEFFIFPILFLALANQLSFECGSINYNIKRFKNSSNPNYFLNNIPLFMLLLMMLIVIIANILVINRPLLLVSIIPLLFLVPLSIKKVPLQFILIIAVIIVTFGKLKLFFAITTIPLLLFLFLWAFAKIKEKKYILRK